MAGARQTLIVIEGLPKQGGLMWHQVSPPPPPPLLNPPLLRSFENQSQAIILCATVMQACSKLIQSGQARKWVWSFKRCGLLCEVLIIIVP